MSVNIQLICILISFVYGIILKVFNMIHNKIINNYNIYINIICNLIYTYIVVLLYIILIYKINRGIFHIYFIIILLLGYFLMSKYVKFFKHIVNNLLYKIKR